MLTLYISYGHKQGKVGIFQRKKTVKVACKLHSHYLYISLFWDFEKESNLRSALQFRRRIKESSLISSPGF